MDRLYFVVIFSMLTLTIIVIFSDHGVYSLHGTVIFSLQIGCMGDGKFDLWVHHRYLCIIFLYALPKLP